MEDGLSGWLGVAAASCAGGAPDYFQAEIQDLPGPGQVCPLSPHVQRGSLEVFVGMKTVGQT